MATKPPSAPSADGPDYESFIEAFAEKLEGFRKSDEPGHEAARRFVGLMRMHQKKWEDQRRLR